MVDPSRVLNPAGQAVLARLGPSGAGNGFCLAGGTALALRLGHRVSVDFDLFSADNPLQQGERDAILEQLGSAFDEVRSIEARDGTLIARCDGVDVSFFAYRYDLLEPTDSAFGLQLASLSDIAAMKISAIIGRGSRKDFIDLHVLMQHAPLDAWITAAERKFPAVDELRAMSLRALVYFEDAEPEPMPKMNIELDWQEVKAGLRNEVRSLGSRYYGLS